MSIPEMDVPSWHPDHKIIAREEAVDEARAARRQALADEMAAWEAYGDAILHGASERKISELGHAWERAEERRAALVGEA